MNSVELKTVAASDKTRAIELLKQGFENEPTYRWCLRADEQSGYEDRLIHCMKADYQYHFQYGFIHGAYIKDKLMGAAFMQPPNMSEIGASFPWIEIIVEKCGEETLKRFEKYMSEIGGVKFEQHSHKVSLIAVDESCRGRGIGTRLLTWVDEIVHADPISMGAQLETSNPDNVRLYERNGYQVMQEKNFNGVQQYLMFKTRF